MYTDPFETGAQPPEDTNCLSINAKLRLVEEINPDQLAFKLIALPNDIRRQQELVAELRKHCENARQELANEEAVLTAAIADETDSRTGRPKFSNAEMRKAELIKRCHDSRVYQVLKQGVTETEAQLNNALFELEKLQNQFAAMQTVCKLQGDRLRFLAN